MKTTTTNPNPETVTDLAAHMREVHGWVINGFETRSDLDAMHRIAHENAARQQS